MFLRRLLPAQLLEPWVGAIVGVAGAFVLTGLVLPFKDEVGLLDTGLLFLLLTFVVSSIWGLPIGIVAAAANYLCLNFFFIEPLHKFVVHDPKNAGAWVLEVTVFLIAAITAGRRVP